MWDDEKAESAKMVSGLRTFIDQSLPKLMTRPYSAGEIGSWSFTPENDGKLQEANRYESKYSGMAELKAFEISLKSGDQLLTVVDKRRQSRFRHRPAAPPMPASSPKARP